MTDNPLESRIALTRAENDRDVIANQKVAIQGLLVLGGMLIVGVSLVGIVWYASDSDMTDALQTCGIVRIDEKGEFSKNVPNPSVDECRKQVLDFYKEKTK